MFILIEGYSLIWDTNIDIMPSYNITINGTFTVNSYTITYIVDGGVYKTATVEYGTEIPTVEAPTKEGHTFSGWSEAPAIMPANDITIEGSFTVNSYVVTYIVDGEVYKTVSVGYGTDVVLIDEPTKEGHTFSGWSEAPAIMPADDITINGTFTVNSYTVTFTIDGEVYKTATVEYGTEIPTPTVPEKEGYTFSGWGNVPETMPAKDITIEGSFAVNSYIVTYLVDGEEYARYTLEYGTEVPIPEVSSKVGYTFNWMDEIPAIVPANNITIKGAFTVNYYTVTYIVDGEMWATDSLAYGSEVVLRDEPTKEGYTFSGWSQVPTTMPANDISIEGTFYVNNYTVTYIIDGEVYEKATVEYGAEIELPSVPKKDGYTFSGWKNVPETMPAKDIIIQGSYIADTAIEDIYLDLENIEVYNLKGVRITETDKLTRGIYIINGNKTFVK